MLRMVERLFRQPVELSAAEAYARWASCYPPCAHNPLMQLEESAVLELFPDVRGVAALDLACGTGRYMRLLLGRGALPVVGLDASHPMLAGARAIGRDLVQADIASLSLRASKFQLVVCALAVGHVRRLARVLNEISRVLAPRGAVIYSDIHPVGAMLGWKRTFQGEDGREYAARHYTHFFSDHRKACSAAGLQIEEVREPRIDFDSRWRGFPALLVIRARKAYP